MENLWLFAIGVFTAFFAINSPPGNIPIFLSLTKAADAKTKKKFPGKPLLRPSLLFQVL